MAGSPWAGSDLHDAARNGWIEKVRRLLRSGADVNWATDRGYTPITSASYMGHVEVVKLLLETPGVEMNNAGKEGFTALHSAAKRGNVEVVRALLEVDGIDVNTVNMFGFTPLNSAAREGNTEIVKLMLETPGVDVNQATSGRTALSLALERGDTVMVDILKAAGATR